MQNPILSQVTLIEKGWRLQSSSAITNTSLNNMPANKTSFYKNGLTKLEVYEIKRKYKKLWRVGYNEKMIEVIMQMEEEKENYRAVKKTKELFTFP